VTELCNFINDTLISAGQPGCEAVHIDADKACAGCRGLYTRI